MSGIIKGFLQLALLDQSDGYEAEAIERYKELFRSDFKSYRSSAEIRLIQLGVLKDKMDAERLLAEN